MPTIVFLSPKGGAGKTTSALLLATQLAKTSKVAILDADPNKNIMFWASGEHKPASIDVIGDVHENNVVDEIEKAVQNNTFVIVDLEGTAAKIAVVAISMADFVIIPTQGSQLDARQAGRAVDLIAQHEKAIRRHTPDYRLPFKVLLTRTSSAIRSRTLKNIRAGFEEYKLPLFQVELHERDAFKAMFDFKRPLELMDKTHSSNVESAIENAKDYSKEVVEWMRATMKEKAK